MSAPRAQRIISRLPVLAPVETLWSSSTPLRFLDRDCYRFGAADHYLLADGSLRQIHIFRTWKVLLVPSGNRSVAFRCSNSMACTGILRVPNSPSCRQPQPLGPVDIQPLADE